MQFAIALRSTAEVVHKTNDPMEVAAFLYGSGKDLESYLVYEPQGKHTLSGGRWLKHQQIDPTMREIANAATDLLVMIACWNWEHPVGHEQARHDLEQLKQAINTTIDNLASPTPF